MVALEWYYGGTIVVLTKTEEIYIASHENTRLVLVASIYAYL